jgi:aldehyde dehydrogenase (NAD+)
MLTSGQQQAIENKEVAEALNADCTKSLEIASNEAAENHVSGESEQSKRGRSRFGGEWTINEFTRDHWITVRHEKIPYLF